MSDYIATLSLVVAILSLIVTCIALYLAWRIPQQIALDQQYAELIAEYRSSEIGDAILSVFDFFENVCSSKIERIEAEYEKRYKQDFGEKYEIFRECKEFDPTKTLHFKRRLLDYFFWLFGDLVFGKSRLVRLPRRKLRAWFGKTEAVLFNIILRMDKASEKMSIKTGDIASDPQFSNGIMDPVRKQLYAESKNWK